MRVVNNVCRQVLQYYLVFALLCKIRNERAALPLLLRQGALDFDGVAGFPVPLKILARFQASVLVAKRSMRAWRCRACHRLVWLPI